MAFTTGNDVNIVQSTDAAIISALEGNDTYIISGDLIGANQTISIDDTQGTNTIQLVGGLSITSSSVTATATQLTLSNGAVVTLLGADTFSFVVGGDSLTGAGGTTEDYSTFVTNTLGLASVPTDNTPVDGGAVEVGGGSSGGEGQSFELTSETDSIIGTSGDDTITGTSANLSTNDRILDSSTTDNDTFNLTATADPAEMDVTNVENVNIDWDAFGTPDISLNSVSGATVTLSSTKSGYLGSANFVSTGRNNITAGDGIVGTLTIGGAEDITIDAGGATEVVVGNGGGADTATENADGTIDLTANSATSVTVNGADDLTVSATSATTVNVSASSTANVTVGSDGDLTLTTSNAEVTLQSTAAVSLDVQAGSTFDVLTLAGDNAVTLDFANAADVNGQEISNGGAIILADALATTIDLDQVEHTSITLEGAADGSNTAATLATGASLILDTDVVNPGDLTLQLSASNDSTSGDTLNLTLNETQSGNALITQGGTGDFEVVNITANADEVSGTDLTIADIQAGDDKVVFTSSANEITVTTMDAGEVDASAVAADFNMTQTTAADITVAGGSADNTIVLVGTTHESTFVGQDGDDSVTFSTAGGDGEAAAILANGNNSVTANSLTSGQLTVQAGSGDDTVSATALTSGKASLTLGDGTNSATLDGTFAGITAVITAGTGNDTVTIDDATHADDSITLDLSTGTDTLVVSEDITAGTLSVSGLDVIAVNGNSDTDSDGTTNDTVVLNASLLDGQSYLITGAGDQDDLVQVESDAAGTLDFSGLDIDNTISKAIGGLAFTANGATGNYTVTGSEGNDSFDFGTATGNNTVTGGKGADSVTLDATDGEDTVIFNVGDLVAATATQDVDTGTPDQLDDTDTITFGNGADVIVNFEVGTDKIDLTAFNLTSGSLTVDTTGGADADGNTDGDIEIADGEYALVAGGWTAATGVFAAATAGADQILVFDADTSSSVSLVGIVFDGENGVTATDLVLS